MGWREDIGTFDLSRLTLVGWLVFVVSLAAGLTAAILVGFHWAAAFPPQPGNNPRRSGPVAIAGIGGAVGFFFAAKFLLHAAGVNMMRPKPVHSAGTNEQANADLRRRMSRAGKWRLFFLLLMPLGFILPCGIAIVLIPGSGQPVSQGITPPQVFGMISIVLPVIGLAGWLLMRGDKGKYAHALAVAEHADEMGFDFSEVPAPEVLALLEEFRMFSTAHHCVGANYCVGEVSDNRIALLDYVTAYQDARGPRFAKVYRQTVLVVFDLDPAVPDFRLAPKGWLEKVLSTISNSSIELPGKVEFNKAFTLSGKEPRKIVGVLSTSAVSLITKAGAAV